MEQRHEKPAVKVPFPVHGDDHPDSVTVEIDAHFAQTVMMLHERRANDHGAGMEQRAPGWADWAWSGEAQKIDCGFIEVDGDGVSVGGLWGDTHILSGSVPYRIDGGLSNPVLVLDLAAAFDGDVEEGYPDEVRVEVPLPETLFGFLDRAWALGRRACIFGDDFCQIAPAKDDEGRLAYELLRLSEAQTETDAGDRLVLATRSDTRLGHSDPADAAVWFYRPDRRIIAVIG